MRLRAHHIYCLTFSKHNFSKRGENFVRAIDRVKQFIRQESNEPLEAICGPDEVCQICPLYKDNGCHSPQGAEEGARKLDSIILKGLGVSVGTILTVSEWRKLIEQKAPLDFCSRCRERHLCDFGDGDTV